LISSWYGFCGVLWYKYCGRRGIAFSFGLFLVRKMPETGIICIFVPKKHFFVIADAA